MTSHLIVRPSEDRDLASITTLYAHHVLYGTGTFELEPPSEAEMLARRTAILAQKRPYLVAEKSGQVVGFCYAGMFRTRSAYAHTLEDSVYVDDQWQHRGIGQALMWELLRILSQQGVRQILALIGDSQNIGSVQLHRRLGFQQVGTLPAVGWKFDRWLDVVVMQKALGYGASLPPVVSLE
ncbi:MAG: GNAT family N-acetyltransferase [Gammaproteobacteria bacterium]|nr:GNAT family N-acetyltransferase [Gammaproteobacteria bacterium]